MLREGQAEPIIKLEPGFPQTVLRTTPATLVRHMLLKYSPVGQSWQPADSALYDTLTNTNPKVLAVTLL